MSGNSWANMGQECIKCHINVYPHKQVRGGGREQAGRSGRRNRGAGGSRGAFRGGGGTGEPEGCIPGPLCRTDRRGLPFPLLSFSLLLHTMAMRPHLSK